MAPRGRARALGTPGGLLLAAALLIAALPVTGPIRDPDFWWHLRTGQLILDRHGLLGTDPYTYTAMGHVWVMHEWLTEVLFALLHSAGGLAHEKLLHSIDLYGRQVIPLIRKFLAEDIRGKAV